MYSKTGGIIRSVRSVCDARVLTSLTAFGARRQSVTIELVHHS